MAGGARKGANAAFGGGLGGAVATIASWGARQFWHVELPAEVASAMAFILITTGGWIGQRLDA
ncbi:MAG: hypothetical protein WDM91_18795 [Rhizomicrobium sp.]